jgi:hypothetical protein
MENSEKMDRFNKLMNECEVFTREEYEFCKNLRPDSELVGNLFYHSWNDTWLNLNIYSEVEHHEKQFRMEIGL